MISQWVKEYIAEGESAFIPIRSMSKVGTPTDNAIIEAINGWIKEELFPDFGLATAKDVPKLLDDYVHNYNYE